MFKRRFFQNPLGNPFPFTYAYSFLLSHSLMQISCSQTVTLKAGKIRVSPPRLLHPPHRQNFFTITLVFYLTIFTNTNILHHSNSDTIIIFWSLTPLLITLVATTFYKQSCPLLPHHHHHRDSLHQAHGHEAQPQHMELHLLLQPPLFYDGSLFITIMLLSTSRYEPPHRRR